MAEKHSISSVSYRPVVGFPMYRVGDDGTAWSKKKHTRTNEVRDGEWRRLNPTTNKDGYLHVGLSNNTHQKTCKIHRLVLEAFAGACPQGMETRHLNGNQTDNRLENLRWGTSKENRADCVRHGTAYVRRMVGETNGSAKLTEVDVREIRQRYAAGGVTYQVLADEFHVTQPNIWNVVHRKRWKHVS